MSSRFEPPASTSRARAHAAGFSRGPERGTAIAQAAAIWLLGALLASAGAAQILLTRNGTDLVIESADRGWVCSIEKTEAGGDTGTAEVRLQELDLGTGVIGPLHVLETYDWEVSPGTSCAVIPAPEVGRVVVAYPRFYKISGIPFSYLRTAHFDPADESVEFVTHARAEFHMNVGSPNNVQGFRLDGQYFLGWSSMTALTSAVRPQLARFEDYDALRADEREILEFPSDIDEEAGPGSFGFGFDEETDRVTLNLIWGGCETSALVRGFKFFEWDADGTALSAAAIPTGDVGASGDHSCLAQRAFGPRFDLAGSGDETLVALVPPPTTGVAGYLPYLVNEGLGTTDLLVDPTPGMYYGINPTVTPETPERSGFPFTLDVALSSDDQWVFASRDFETNRLALHRIPADSGARGAPPMLQPGTQRPGPEFCGIARSIPEAEPWSYRNANHLVDLEEGLLGGELIVAYYTCPGGDPADAELVVDRFPLAFPVLVDDRGYATTRGQALTEPAPGVLANDSGLVAPTLDLFAGPDGGTVQLAANGSFVYTPHPAFCGTDEFTYRVMQDSEPYLARAVIAVECPAAAAWWTFDEHQAGAFLIADDRIIDIGGSGRDANVQTTVASRGPVDPEVVNGSPFSEQSPALQLSSAADDMLFFNAGFSGFNDAGPAAGTAFDFGAGTSFTLEAVIRLPENSADDSDVIVGKVSGAGTSNSWFMQVSSAGFLQGKIHDGTTSTTVNGTQLIDDDEWHRVAFVRDTGDDELRLYVDGVLDGTETDTTSASLANGVPITVGAFPSGARQFGGVLDEVRITATDLDPEDFLYDPSHLPFAAPDEASALPGPGTVTVDVTANDDFGLDGPKPGAIEVVGANGGVAVVLDGGTTSDPTDDELEVTPDGGVFSEDIEVTYRITDLNGDTSEGILTVRVAIFADGFESGDTGAWQ